MKLTLAKLEKLIDAACKEGKFEDDFYFEHAAPTAGKLFADRKALLEAAEKAHKRLPPHSPSAILLGAAIEEAYAGWPSDIEPTSPAKS